MCTSMTVFFVSALCCLWHVTRVQQPLVMTNDAWQLCLCRPITAWLQPSVIANMLLVEHV